MKDKAILEAIGIICITILEVTNLIFYKVDGAVLSGVVGAIVFILTKKRYQE
jgi:hypothetical protein